jgi:hypothetical protein
VDDEVMGFFFSLQVTRWWSWTDGFVARISAVDLTCAATTAEEVKV